MHPQPMPRDPPADRYLSASDGRPSFAATESWLQDQARENKLQGLLAISTICVTDLSSQLADSDPMPPEMNSQSKQSRVFVCVDYGCSYTGIAFGTVPDLERHQMDWGHEEWDSQHAVDTDLPEAPVWTNATQHACLSCTQKPRQKRLRTFYMDSDSRAKSLQYEVLSNALDPTTLVPMSPHFRDNLIR